MSNVDLDLAVLEGVLTVRVNGVEMLKLVGVRRICLNDRIIYEPRGHKVK